MRRNDPLDLGEFLNGRKGPAIMGILNVTPDSFSDGGRFNERSRAIEHAFEMVEQGADMIDVGGESTRPFAESVITEEEIERTVPVIETMADDLKVPVSIDTRHVEVARRALEAGASMINDVNGLRGEGMEELSLEWGIPVVVMHMKGTPKDMQVNPCYDDVISEVRSFLAERVDELVAKGMKKEQVIIDPGIGFGKRREDNLKLINGLDAFLDIGCPVLIGASRKSFIGQTLDLEVDQRLEGSLAVAVIAYMRGASVIRTHDVLETRRTVDMTRAMIDCREA